MQPRALLICSLPAGPALKNWRSHRLLLRGYRNPRITCTQNQNSSRRKLIVNYTAVGAVASLGFVETTYLTVSKALGANVTCPLSNGCDTVLSSAYAELPGGIPLSALGAAAYGAVIALACLGYIALHKGQLDKEMDIRKYLIFGGSILSSTSSYLIYILLTEFPGDTCPWCLTSALVSFSITFLCIRSLTRRELIDAAGPGAGIFASTLLILSLVLGNSSQAGDISELPYKDPEITEHSSARARDLARKLKDAGAKMYGAFWCSHCYSQKQLFGEEAMQDFPYVECFPEGWKRGQELAAACANPPGGPLEGFPTWILNGERLTGEKTFEELEMALDKKPVRD